MNQKYPSTKIVWKILFWANANYFVIQVLYWYRYTVVVSDAMPIVNTKGRLKPNYCWNLDITVQCGIWHKTTVRRSKLFQQQQSPVIAMLEYYLLHYMQKKKVANYGEKTVLAKFEKYFCGKICHSRFFLYNCAFL